MANRSTAKFIDEYSAGFPPETQTVLKALRALIKACAPWRDRDDQLRDPYV